MKNNYLAITAFLFTVYFLMYGAYGLISFSSWVSFKEALLQRKSSLDVWIAIDLAIYSIFAIFTPAVFLREKYGNVVATNVPPFISGLFFIGVEHAGFGAFGENEALIFSALVGIWIFATLIGLCCGPPKQ